MSSATPASLLPPGHRRKPYTCGHLRIIERLKYDAQVTVVGPYRRRWGIRPVSTEGDPRIRILFVIGTLDIGGSEKQLVQIATRLDRRRFAPAVCCLSKAGPLTRELTDAGIPVTVIGLNGISHERGLRFLRALARLPRDLLRLLWHVRAYRPTILHGVLFHAYVLGALAGMLTRVPVVIASRRSLGLFKNQRPHYRFAERFANRWTDLVIANSEAVRHDALSSEGLQPQDVVVIHNGLDVDPYLQSWGPELRQVLGLDAGPVVIVVANFMHYKGHSYFLKAWADVCRKIENATALLVGDGPLRGACEAEARDLGVDDRVRFLGTREDVPALLAVADLLVHPSLEEGFSNAVLEAMAAARPVVATHVGGNAEAIQDGETGFLVPARDVVALSTAMLQVLQRSDMGRSLGDAGRRRVQEHFQLPAMIQQYESIYLDLLERRAVDRVDVRHRRSP